MKTNSKIQTVNVNTVANYAEAHAFSMGIRKVTGTISQQCGALSGIPEETIEITMGKGAERRKVSIKVVDFFGSIDAPYGDRRVIFRTVNSRWADYLRNAEGTFMVCKEVIQRIKVGKQNYVLYRKDEEGKYHILGYGYDPAARPLRKVVATGHGYRMTKLGARLEFLKKEFSIENSIKPITESTKTNLLVIHNITTSKRKLFHKSSPTY